MVLKNFVPEFKTSVTTDFKISSNYIFFFSYDQNNHFNEIIATKVQEVSF